jgi:hypothetical protein
LRPSKSDDKQPDAREYGLRLLYAQQEPNTTPISLVEGLIHLPRLVYLDLSYTAPAKDPTVLSALSRLLDLQVLKLRGVGLRDQHVQILANAIQTRVRLLDVRNNFLTDSGVISLVRECFLPASTPELASGYHTQQHEWSAPATTSSNTLTANSLKNEHLDEHLLKQLTTAPLAGRTTLEDLPHVGITHLYIADNDISVDGLASLLGTSRLHVLDGGTVLTAEALQKLHQSSATSVGGQNHFVKTVRFPGAGKLVPVLGNEAAQNLAYLRLHHAVVTENVPAEDNAAGQNYPHETVEDRIQALLAKRPNRSSLPSRSSLHPSDLPHLQTLVLTDVPASVPPSSPIIESLIQFITACSNEAYLAALQAQSNYSLPPGRARANAELQHAKSLFSLERIVLEITPVRKVDLRKGPSKWMPQGYYNPGAAKSSTGDLDSENLWASAIDDYSFFGEGRDEDEGDGILDDERERARPMPPRSEVQRAPATPDVDLVRALALFRQTKFAEYKQMLHLRQSRGGSSAGDWWQTSSSTPSTASLHYVEGHWKGQVQVVRNPAPGGQKSGVVDVYGNFFEKGYLYA